MIEEITSLFLQTFSDQGGDINEQIHNATQSLDEYGGSPEFCQCIFQIYESDQILRDIQRAAIIYLTNMILSHWEEEIPPESKLIIINSLPNILLNMSDESYPLLNKLAASIVRKTFFEGEWNEITDIIISGFESKDDNQFSASLILLNSISLLFNQVSDEKIEIYSELSTNFLQHLTDYVSTSPSLFHVSICFKIAHHFSRSQIPPLFQSNPEILQIWLCRAMQIAEPTDDPNYYMFAHSSLKFLLIYIYKYNLDMLPPELPMEMLNSVIECIKNVPNAKVLGKCALFIKRALENEYTGPGILGDFEEFTKIVILPFFILTPTDMEYAMDDPFTFILNFHSNCTDDSDARSIISRAFELQSSVNPEIVQTYCTLFLSILPLRAPEYDQITYSLCFLFSTVSKHINPIEVPSFCEMMLPLLQSDSFIVRSGCLLALRDMKNVPADIILIIFQILVIEEEVILVKYYAAISLSSILKNIDEETAQIIQSNIDEKTIADIIKNYFILSQEFRDYDFVNLIQSYIEFFGQNLLEVSPSFISDIFNMFLEFSTMEAQSNEILKSIFSYLNLLAENSQFEVLNEIIEFLIGQIAEALKNDSLVPKSIVSVAELVLNMIAISPSITESHWKILELFDEIIQFSSENLDLDSNSTVSALKSMLPSSELSYSFNTSFTIGDYYSLLSAVCTAYKNLIIKDTENVRKQETASDLINIAVSLISCQHDIKEVGPAFTFLATLLVILTGSEIVDLSELYEKVLPIVADGLLIDMLRSSSATLFGAMMIFNSDYVFEILQDHAQEVLVAWSESISKATIFVFMTVVSKKCQIFGQDVIVLLIQKIIKVLEKLRINKSLFNDNLEEEDLPDTLNDTYYMDIKKLSIFDDNEIFLEFENLLSSIEQSNHEIIQEIQSVFEESIETIIKEAESQLTNT